MFSAGARTCRNCHMAADNRTGLHRQSGRMGDKHAAQHNPRPGRRDGNRGDHFAGDRRLRALVWRLASSALPLWLAPPLWMASPLWLGPPPPLRLASPLALAGLTARVFAAGGAPVARGAAGLRPTAEHVAGLMPFDA